MTRIRTFCSGSVLAAIFFPAILAAERITVKLPQEAGLACSDLRVPKWTVPAYDPSLDYAGITPKSFERGVAKYQFREGARLLVGLVVPPPFKGRVREPLYSPDVYAVVRKNGKTVLEPASKTEWETAKVLPASKGHLPGFPRDGQPLGFGGRSFAPSGRYWEGSSYYSSFLSSDNAYEALVSWDGTIKYGDILEWENINGHYFIDLYRVPSGRKLGTIQGSFHGAEPHDFAGFSYWIDGPRFVLPISKDMKRFVVCEVQ
ncbi:MAG TPA: hypothetical protein VFW94_14425 [Candidatus Acidoferrales bacterium]|nr:hypothetical protein [Candidatus Acidoferrales bacterium]